MGLIADHQIPAAFGGHELLPDLLVAREFVEPGDDQVGFKKPVAAVSGFELVVGEDFEGELESPPKLVLPLFGQAAGADDQSALEVAPDDQLLDE
jgi:hypothetical protein